MSYQLTNWTITLHPKHLRAFLDPDFSWKTFEKISIFGEIGDGHPYFSKGSEITSSHIISFSKRLVYTDSGSCYELIGNPGKIFFKVLEDCNAKYDEDNPLAFLRSA